MGFCNAENGMDFSDSDGIVRVRRRFLFEQYRIDFDDSADRDAHADLDSHAFPDAHS